ncbi:MAG TPA: LacI family DNA-binding transcriptional regulator [Anaerolineales bacterium]|nr:LacI family DNA-binding transcriptional regulator [Anaerolineales bacterium]
MPSTKRATSVDVAKKAGVSRTTVSFVLNDVPGVSISEPTRQRVLKAAKSLNYHPDMAGRKLASGKSNTIGLVLRQNPEQVFADAFLLQVVLGVEAAAAEMGFHVLLKPVEPDDSQGYARLIHENYVDGILVSGPREDDEEIIRLHQQNEPVLLLGQLPNSHIPFVDIDAVAGAATAVQHLIDQGHRHIAMITNAPLTYTSAQQRRDGYHQALKKAGLEINSAFLREGNYTPASGFAAMSQLLELMPRPTAVFVASDVVAMGAIQAIKRDQLRVPNDVAVVGFDDVPLAGYYDPPLTTIRLPAYGLGWAAGDRLVRMIQGESLQEPQLFLESELVVRESSTRV